MMKVALSATTATTLRSISSCPNPPPSNGASASILVQNNTGGNNDNMNTGHFAIPS